MSFTEYDVAICGVAFNLPQGVNTPSAFQAMRASGESLIRDYRQDMPPNSHDEQHCHCGFIDNLYAFPYHTFGLTKRQATLMDPQQRQLLMLAKQALFDAGLDVSPGNRIATLLASGVNYYLLDNLLRHNASNLDVDINQLVRLNDSSFTATRVASNLGLQGPAFTVQTACSSALTALHLGCQSILSGESDAALVGACSLLLPQHRQFAIRDEDILANDGVCRPLDSRATGTVASSGGIIFVLRPAQLAAEEGQKIYAVVKATSINNDGGGQASFGAPSVFGQQSVMEDALGVAELAGSDLSLHELHGTATLLGDVIEMQSTKNAMQLVKDDHLPLGAIKSQIGHTDSAAGLFGVLNCVAGLATQHTPAMPNFATLNPKLTHYFDGFASPENAYELNAEPHCGQRIGSVSSFGIGGSNGCAILVVDDQCNGFEQPYSLIDWGEMSECVMPISGELTAAKTSKSSLAASSTSNNLSESTILTLLETLLGESIADTSLGLFELGGDSILLLDVIDTLKSDYQLTLTLSELMDVASVDELIVYIVSKSTKPELSKVQDRKPSVDSEYLLTNSNNAESYSATPLNEQQKRLWLSAKMQPMGDALTISNLFELQTPIGLTQLVQQLQRWVDKHPILNSILVEDDQFLGWQGRQAPIHIDVNNAASKPVALGLIKNQLAQSIDLQGPLSRFYLQPIRQQATSMHLANTREPSAEATGINAPCQWLVGFAIHHAVIDGIALSRLTAELASVFVQPIAE